MKELELAIRKLRGHKARWGMAPARSGVGRSPQLADVVICGTHRQVARPKTILAVEERQMVHRAYSVYNTAMKRSVRLILSAPALSLSTRNRTSFSKSASELSNALSLSGSDHFTASRMTHQAR